MRSFCLSLIMCILFLPSILLAFNDDYTHPRLTERASTTLNSSIDTYLKENLGINKGLDEPFVKKTILEWLKHGATMEDAEDDCRASNHFHDPNQTWGGFGLTDTQCLVNLYCLMYSQYRHDALISDITWATGYCSKNISDTDDVVIDENKWGWASAREYFYTYLTGKDFEGTEIGQLSC